MKTVIIAGLLFAAMLQGQDATAPKADPWTSLHFLEGTWAAKTQGSSAPSTSGIYTFALELSNHIMARHSSSDPGCRGPATFDCDHGDLLYVYQSSPGKPLEAIYFDNEGHVIHYSVSAPAPGTVVFLSEPAPGPQFRLVYELKSSVMSGKFQVRMPGKSDWNSYLEWAGSKIIR